MAYADKIQSGAGVSISGDGSSGNPLIVSASPSHLYYSADAWFPSNGNVSLNGNYSMSATTYTNGGGGAYSQMAITPADWNTVDVFMYWVNADTDMVTWNLLWFFGPVGAGFPFGANGQTFPQDYTVGVSQRLNKTLMTSGLAIPGGDLLKFNLYRSNTDPSSGNQIVIGLDVVKVT